MTSPSRLERAARAICSNLYGREVYNISQDLLRELREALVEISGPGFAHVLTDKGWHDAMTGRPVRRAVSSKTKAAVKKKTPPTKKKKRK